MNINHQPSSTTKKYDGNSIPESHVSLERQRRSIVAQKIQELREEQRLRLFHVCGVDSSVLADENLMSNDARDLYRFCWLLPNDPVLGTLLSLPYGKFERGVSIPKLLNLLLSSTKKGKEWLIEMREFFELALLQGAITPDVALLLLNDVDVSFSVNALDHKECLQQLARFAVAHGIDELAESIAFLLEEKEQDDFSIYDSVPPSSGVADALNTLRKGVNQLRRIDDQAFFKQCLTNVFLPLQRVFSRADRNEYGVSQQMLDELIEALKSDAVFDTEKWYECIFEMDLFLGDLKSATKMRDFHAYVKTQEPIFIFDFWAYWSEFVERTYLWQQKKNGWIDL